MITLTGTAYKFPYFSGSLGKVTNLVRFYADNDFDYNGKFFPKDTFDKNYGDAQLLDQNKRTDKLQAVDTPPNQFQQRVAITLERKHGTWQILDCEPLGKVLFKPNKRIKPGDIERFPHPEDIPQPIKDACIQYWKARKDFPLSDIYPDHFQPNNFHTANWTTDTGDPKNLLNLEHTRAELQKIAPKNTQIKIGIQDNQLIRVTLQGETPLPHAKAIEILKAKSFRKALSKITLFRANASHIHLLPDSAGNSTTILQSKPKFINNGDFIKINDTFYQYQNESWKKISTKKFVQALFTHPAPQKNQHPLRQTIDKLLNLGLQHRNLLQKLAANPTLPETSAEIRHNMASIEKAYNDFEALTDIQGSYTSIFNDTNPLTPTNHVLKLTEQHIAHQQTLSLIPGVLHAEPIKTVIEP
jgi:hypothetical protein